MAAALGSRASQSRLRLLSAGPPRPTDNGCQGLGDSVPSAVPEGQPDATSAFAGQALAALVMRRIEGTS